MLCVLPAHAYAYLDPGAGSMLLQIILGGVGGIVVLAKLYWHKIKLFFVRHPKTSDQSEPSDPDGAAGDAREAGS